ncbi:glycine betaine/L-proline transporter ProP [Candidatus Erwinia haradaeae]|uniref:Proline/betaine transporter, partial n=1 Tax=Candidatus Erwinia haradaeae TaxID=1922217 RepID=A0A451D4Q3_9GAMM|nr:glycine betaine/L-proline transporter ProP [Candidatus Erwinia haradaeae]VFP80699.1 Proline/betaine transporter [Candidatus Erwinia haradaeae]
MPFKKTHASLLGLQDVTIINEVRLRKAIIATVLGNAIEWFDFSVYGFMAGELGQVFFSGIDIRTQRITVLAIFSLPFLIRPLGGIFFGILGDKYGRKKILSITIMMMSISTACISCIPSYAVIGIWSPTLLLICKIMQGFSVGGEYIGSAIFIAEHSPDRKRGLIGSWLDFGSIAGFLLGAILVVIISCVTGTECFLSWGWRILFFMALPFGAIGLYLRYMLEESPAFQGNLKKSIISDNSVIFSRKRDSYIKLIIQYRRSLLVCMGLVITTNVTYYMLLAYMPTYLSKNLNFSEDDGIIAIIVIMISMLFLQPTIGLMSDKFGCRPLVILGSFALLFFSIPCFLLINAHVTGLMFLGLLILALILNSFTGVMASSLPAMFPAHIRCSILATMFNISVFIASLTPTIAAWLVEETENLYMPAYYLMIAGSIGVLTGIKMQETANLPLHGANPVASDIIEARAIIKENHNHIEKKIKRSINE